ncbi:MAG: class I SAM-dependent RNA methyltransferase [Treponema sp.]|jgi:putative N6-adenine-specific DNA methylase|nr:class I SAM-dependent RNA methyltransferase [Treponema sp.]
MPNLETAVALCAVGAEKTVSNELRKMNLKIIEGGFGKIRFQADISALYRCLMSLRAADRVLLEIASFRALDFDDLFEGVRHRYWEEYVPKNMGLKVAKVRTNRSTLKAETSIQAIVHKAAAERLCAKRGINRLPEHGEQAELRVYIEKDQASVLLDLSGDPLFKRGYRKAGGGPAPLRETTAAAILLGSGWRRKFPLYDPFCGSGTIAVEAAMYAWDMAPGLGRHFALEQLLTANKGKERDVREELLAKVDFSRQVRIGGSDADAASVLAAKANMERAITLVRDGKGANPDAGSFPPVQPAFRTLSMEEAKSPFAHTQAPDAKACDAEGFILTNPPYGQRLGDTETAEKNYAQMSILAKNFPGWKLAVITDHPGFESFFGEKADSCKEITNGAIRSYLYQYEKL